MAHLESTDGGLRELALFAGAGGGILGGKLLGWRTVCAVEWEPYPASVLACRQNDGLLPPFPIWDDVRTFDGRPWRGIVDVVSGGFPCQDISVAGKGAGIEGERSGLWSEFARIIGEVRPRFAFVENSPALLTRGLGTVLGDLAALGYDCRWTVLGASDVGALHRRDRVWIVANSNSNGWQGFSYKHSPGSHESSKRGSTRGTLEEVHAANPNGREFKLGGSDGRMGREELDSWLRHREIASEPFVRRGVDDLAARLDRLKAIGNGQVPLCAATAWRFLMGGGKE